MRRAASLRSTKKEAKKRDTIETVFKTTDEVPSKIKQRTGSEKAEKKPRKGTVNAQLDWLEEMDNKMLQASMNAKKKKKKKRKENGEKEKIKKKKKRRGSDESLSGLKKGTESPP